MRIGVFAKTFAGSDPRGVLAQVAGAGFTTTQYNMSCSGLASLPDANWKQVTGEFFLTA